MRLTLRTLLSWKDGMLDEVAARDLAAKVDASDAARRLVERIDEVVARPTLSASAPDAAGFAAAANTTAEYLDNVLEADRLGDFERACFASEVQLAETAAAHEMLAEWSREPAPALDAAARRRLLAAVRARAGAERVGADAPSLAISASSPRPATGAARPARTAVPAWLLVAAAFALLVTLVGVLGWSMTKRGGRPAVIRDVASRPAEVREQAGVAKPSATEPSEPAPAAAAVDSGVDGGVPGPAVPSVGEPAAATVSAPVEPAGPRRDVDDVPAAAAGPAPQPPAPDTEDGDFPPFTADEPMDTVATATDGAANPFAATEPPAGPTAPGVPADPRVPRGDALAIAAPAVPPVAVPAAADPPRPAAGPREARAAVVGPAVLLHRSAGAAADAWVAGVDGTPIGPPADLVAPPFGRPAFVVDGTRITLEPGTRAVLGRDADGTPRLEVVFGAAVAAGGDRLGVTAGGLAGVVTAGLAAPLGVEARITRPPGGDVESAARLARVVPTAGRLDWRPTAATGGPLPEPAAGGAATAVPAGQALVWRSGRPEAALLEAAGPPPGWLVGRAIDDPVDAHAARALAARLAAGTAVVPALRELAADRRSERRMAAAAALALVGDFEAVARLMCAAGADALRETEWGRLDAVAVQPALARGPKAAEALSEAFAAQAPPGAAAAIVRFARGLTDEELAAGGDVELVAALESPHLIVRRYAIRNLVEITGIDGADRLRYRADRPAEALREGAAWWRARLEQGRIRRGPAAAR